MIEVRQTTAFSDWLRRVPDLVARRRILARLDRLQAGNRGDIKPVGAGVSELWIDHGPGYRIYLAQRGADLVILLGGGSKRTQPSDIERAKRLAEELDDGP